MPMMRRSFSAVGGIRTASSSSHALAEAMRWLTGQMPQMRAISDGHLRKWAALAEFFKAAELRDMKTRIGHAARFIQMQRDLRVASMRVTGSIVIVFVAAIAHAPKRVIALNSGCLPSSSAVTAS